MKVYRFLSEIELKNILLGNISELGSVYNNNDYGISNSHKYKNDIKYLHFFKQLKSIKYISSLYKHDKGKFYICEFNIPLSTLLKYRGKGYYDVGGMDYISVPEIEYAIPVKLVKKEWLLDYKEYKYNNNLDLNK